MSEKKLSRFRPIYANVNSRWSRWLTRNHSGNCDVRHNGESIYNHIHTLVSWLGFGIAWGFDINGNGNHFIHTMHLMAWDHCIRGEAASKVWIGRMEIFA